MAMGLSTLLMKLVHSNHVLTFHRMPMPDELSIDQTYGNRHD
jgi:hypothetical protein